MSPYKQAVKHLFLNEMVQNKCNIVMTTVLHDSPDEKEYLDVLIKAGYRVHYNYVFLDYDTIVLRTKNRGQRKGRLTEDTPEQKEKWEWQLKYALELASNPSVDIQLIHNLPDSPKLVSSAELSQFLP